MIMHRRVGGRGADASRTRRPQKKNRREKKKKNKERKIEKKKEKERTLTWWKKANDSEKYLSPPTYMKILI